MLQNFKTDLSRFSNCESARHFIMIRLNHVLFYFGANFCPITRIEEDENIINELLRELNTGRNFDSLTNILHKIYLVLNKVYFYFGDEFWTPWHAISQEPS